MRSLDLLIIQVRFSETTLANVVGLNITLGYCTKDKPG